MWQRFRFFLLMMLWAGPMALCQSVSEQFVVNHWSTDDGLPLNSINKIIQSKKGYLWLTTFDGLVRFDGVKFKIFASGNYSGLPSNRILNIKEAQDGSLWLVTEQNFLVKYQNGVFKHIAQADGINNILANTIKTDAQGGIWIGSNQGIFVYKNGDFSAFKPHLIGGTIDRLHIEHNGAIWFRNQSTGMIYRFFGKELKPMIKTKSDYEQIAFAKNGDTLWVATGNGLYRFVNNEIELVSPYFTGKREASYMGISAEGALLLATKLAGLYKFEKGVTAPFLTDDQFRISPFHTDSQGNHWIISRHHVYRNSRLIYSTPSDLANYLIDREGSLWIGTFDEGLYRLKPNPFKIFNKKDGLPAGNIYPVIEAHDGSIWIGTHGKGVVRIKNGTVETGYLPVDDATLNYIRTLYQKRDGTILMGKSGGGIWQLNGHSFYRYPTPQPLAGTTVASIFEDSKGRLWVGSTDGLYMQFNNKWTHFDSNARLANYLVRFITEAPDSSIWMATNGGGIIHYYNETIKIYSKEEGLSSNLIRALHIEPANEPGNYALWIGSEDNGLDRLPVRGNTPVFAEITHYGEQDGLFDNAIHRILEDDNGYFWMSSNRGIFRVAKEELQAFAKGEINHIRSISYTKKDGLPTSEANGGMQPAGMKATDGRLWFPTQKGVVVINPDNMLKNKKPPPVVIEVVATDGQPLRNGYGADLKLEKGTRDFEISYTALSLLVPEKNRFKYKLKGFDDAWHEAGTRRTAFYTNIPPGHYTFNVIASNNSGIWNEKGASLNITVVPYFYETNWFYGLCALGFLLLVFGFVKVRTRRLAAAEKHLTALVDERTHELRLEKNKTEQQANELRKLDEAKSKFFSNISHEFRTPLTLIMNPLNQLVSGKLGRLPETVSRYHQLMLRNSHRMQRLIDQLLDLASLNEGRVKLNVEEIELIAFTANIYELFEDTAKTKDLDINLQAATINEISNVWIDREKMEKVIANLLSNAIKYTEPGDAIDVAFAETKTTCEIQISDTGIGISERQQQHIFDRFYQVESGDTRSSEGVGIGLALVKEFVELHGGKISLESTEGEGSCFTITLKKGRGHFDDKNLMISREDEFPASANDRYLSADNGSTTTQQVNAIQNTAPVETPSESSHITPDEDKTTVMIVEDNADLRTFVREILSPTYRVLEAGNGQIALGLIAKELPDLIVADIMMPEMDGRTLNRKLKEDPALAAIPLIFLTAKTGAGEKIEGFEEGADDYLTKPFNAEVLLARIDNLIESRLRLRKLLQAEKVGTNTLAQQETEDSFLLKTDEILETAFSDPEFSINDLAEKLHIDRTNLYRKLKEKTGLTPQQYVTRFRLEKSARLFREQRGSVSEVAYAVGFNSLSWFARQFREQFGVNPSEYLGEIET